MISISKQKDVEKINASTTFLSRIKQISYYCCFIVFGLANLVFFVSIAPFPFKYIPLFSFFHVYTIPGSLAALSIKLPIGLNLLVFIFVLFYSLILVARRFWLIIKRKEYIPHSFKGMPMLISVIGGISFMLGVIALLVTILLGGGSGVPAGLVFIPSMYCIPWGFFLTEVLSLKRPTQNNG